MRPGKLKPAARDRGLSLIELVAAMAVFALVAVMGAQALGGMIRLRQGIAARSAEAAALDRTASLLRADLAAVVPMLFYPPGRAAPQSALSFRNGVLALSAGGQPGLDSTAAASGTGSPPGLQRIEWQLAGGRLSRRFWTALTPAAAAARQPQMPVLEGVTGLHLRSYWEGTGWRSGVQPLALPPGPGSIDSDQAGAAPEVYSSILPLAVEVTLDTRAFGRITLVETLK